MIWLFFALLTACVILAITRTLRRAPVAESAGDSEIAAYKAQLGELDREEERGTLCPQEAQQTRTEVSRRLLKASRQSVTVSSRKSGVFSTSLAFVAVAAVLSLGSISTYLYYGRPGIPDQPLEARLNAPLSEQTVDIQIANMERRLRQNPSDVMGWASLATIYFKAGVFEKAADIYQTAIRAGGKDERLLIGLAESLTFANDGVITDQAAQALQAALAINPASLRGRFWSGLLAEQNGKKAEAETIYRDLLAAPLHPTLKKVVTQRLDALTGVVQVPDRTQEEASPEERRQERQMISGMVEKLAARLKQDKSDLDGWLMLIRSYAVLKEPEKAKAAMEAARVEFAADKAALDQIDAITHDLSFAFTDGKTAPKDNAAATSQPSANPAAVPDGGGEGQMIRGMVERLAESLKENKSDLDGWLKLIRSYAVLKETVKAQDAANTARQEFASDAKALEQIDTLAQGLGLALPGANGGQPKS